MEEQASWGIGTVLLSIVGIFLCVILTIVALLFAFKGKDETAIILRTWGQRMLPWNWKKGNVKDDTKAMKKTLDKAEKCGKVRPA